MLAFRLVGTRPRARVISQKRNKQWRSQYRRKSDPGDPSFDSSLVPSRGSRSTYGLDVPIDYIYMKSTRGVPLPLLGGNSSSRNGSLTNRGKSGYALHLAPIRDGDKSAERPVKRRQIFIAHGGRSIIGAMNALRDYASLRSRKIFTLTNFSYRILGSCNAQLAPPASCINAPTTGNSPTEF